MTTPKALVENPADPPPGPSFASSDHAVLTFRVTVSDGAATATQDVTVNVRAPNGVILEQHRYR